MGRNVSDVYFGKIQLWQLICERTCYQTKLRFVVHLIG